MVENALDRKLRDIRQNGKVLVPYLTAGDPNLQATYKLLEFYASEGATMIEIGLPFSDPMADGPVIQKAMARALGTRLEDVFEIASEFRKNYGTPLLMMGYLNTVMAYGLDTFARQLGELEIAGAIIVDLPLEEATPVARALNANNVHLIPLVSPLTTSDRLSMMRGVFSGFAYLISVTGVTGARDRLPSDIRDKAAEVRNILGLPVLLGFGVSGGETIRQFKSSVDGFIVGSALLKAWEADGFKVGEHLRTLWSELASASCSDRA